MISRPEPKDSHLDKTCFCGKPSARTRAHGFLGLCRFHAENSFEMIGDGQGGMPKFINEDAESS